MLSDNQMGDFVEEYIDAMSLLAEGVGILLGETQGQALADELKDWVGKVQGLLGEVAKRHGGV